MRQAPQPAVAARSAESAERPAIATPEEPPSRPAAAASQARASTKKAVRTKATVPLSVVTRSSKRSVEAGNATTRVEETKTVTVVAASSPVMTSTCRKVSSVRDALAQASQATRKRKTAPQSLLVAEPEEHSGSNKSICVDELAPYDQDSFIETMRAVPMLHPVSDDDINLSAEAIDVGYGSEEQSGSDSDAETEQWSYVDDVDSADSEEEDESISAFDIPDDDLRAIAASGWEVYDSEHSGQLAVDAADDFYNGPWGPTQSAVAFADSPLGLFFYFLPKQMWLLVADESNRYRMQSIPAMAEDKRRGMLCAQQKDPNISVPTLETITAKLKCYKRFQPHEFCRLIGLLISRTLCPMRDGVAKHWSSNEDGSLPRGTWGRYMKRARYEEITRFIHFNNNETSNALHDKAWKIRPILQTVETTFRRGYRLGKCISFDEGMMPNKSRFNPLRVYNKEKPNKWGTKFYMACCSQTAYCARIEVYCGKEKVAKKNVGPAAVVRNITKVLQGQPPKRLIVTDNFYSSVALSLKLLSLGHYHVGTVRTNRLGWCKSIQYTQKKRPKTIPRGTYRIAQAKEYPELVALSWMDSRPVNMLATGCSTVPTTVLRTEKDGSRSVVRCPSIVPEYLRGMGGVDVHDQIRLQRYSIQKTVAMRKYYKQLFLGLVDMAITNGFIVHKFVQRLRGEKVATHANYMRLLHKELLALEPADFESNMLGENLLSQPLRSESHLMTQVTERYRVKSKTEEKRRQYSCKVCSAMSTGKSSETTYVCMACDAAFGGRVALCNLVRRVEDGNSLTCFQIWHDSWKNGTQIPSQYKKKIRFRRGKRKHSQVDSSGDSDTMVPST